jgi:hypothetical protein
MIEVAPDYISIETVRNICEPWIDLWGGDEWGESMRDLHGACRTSHGFSDEDCALFATKLLENLISLKEEWIDREGYGLWGYSYDDENGALALAETRTNAREARDYWLKGGNLGDWAGSPTKAQVVIAQMPSWLFEDNQIPLFEETE